MLEDFMQRSVDKLIETVRPDALRVQRELSELQVHHGVLQVRYGELVDEFQHFRLQLRQTGRIARRLDRAASEFENARNDQAHASGWWGDQWEGYG